MSTIRLTVVNAFAAMMATATGLPVHRNLDYALEDRNLPAGVVTSGDDGESAEFSVMGDRAWRVDVEVSILVANSADRESNADAYEALLLAAIEANTTLAGVALDIEIIGGDWEFDLGDCARRAIGFRIHFSL